MADLIASIFATHPPIWADIQALLNILLTAGERELVISRAKDEAQHFQEENPNGTPTQSVQFP